MAVSSISGLLTTIEVKMAEYWPNSFLYFDEFMDWDTVQVHEDENIKPS